MLALVDIDAAAGKWHATPLLADGETADSRPLTGLEAWLRPAAQFLEWSRNPDGVVIARLPSR